MKQTTHTGVCVVLVMSIIFMLNVEAWNEDEAISNCVTGSGGGRLLYSVVQDMEASSARDAAAAAAGSSKYASAAVALRMRTIPSRNCDRAT